MERKLEFIDGLGSARTMVNAPDIFAVIPKDMNMTIDNALTAKAEDWFSLPGPSSCWVEDFADVMTTMRPGYPARPYT